MLDEEQQPEEEQQNEEQPKEEEEEEPWTPPGMHHHKLACSRLAEKHAQIRSLNGPSQCMHGHMNMPRVECMHS